MASPALTPSQGAAEAWASLPPKKTSKWETARQVPQPLGRPGVDHHGGVDVVEGAVVEHE
jgi:hypothetical protein